MEARQSLKVGAAMKTTALAQTNLQQIDAR